MFCVTEYVDMFYCSKNKLFFKYCSLLYSIYAPPLSNTSFSTKSLLLTSTVCSDWPTGTVHCDWPNTTSHVGNVTPLSIIASFSFQNTFTFMHLSDAFIQSDLQCIQVIHCFCQYVCSLGIEPTTSCAAIAMLYH